MQKAQNMSTSNDYSKKPVVKRDDKIESLAPFVQELLRGALEELHADGYTLYPFETYRSPERQQALYNQGRSIPGKKVTNAKPWQSFHQYGLAVDLVYKVKNRWVWDADYDKPSSIMQQHSFEPIDFERVHFQITQGLTWREACELQKQGGLEAVWKAVESRFKARL
jgi:peptidoglycan L-alanyl-D-glutamate endopeptidase CwlK